MRKWRVDPNAVSTVLVSHLHGDHFGGLPFLLLDAQLAIEAYIGRHEEQLQHLNRELAESSRSLVRRIGAVADEEGANEKAGSYGVFFLPDLVCHEFHRLRGRKNACVWPGLEDRLESKVGLLSGGWKMRVALARVLLGRPDVLLMDEPTNHLDLETKEMLVEALKDFEGTMIFVSHDRHFLAALSNRVLELTPEGPHQYGGGYTEYVARTGQEAPGLRS